MKVLVIGATEAKAIEGSKLFEGKEGLRQGVRQYYPGSRRMPRLIQGLVVYHESGQDLGFAQKALANYANLPIKVTIGPNAAGAAAEKMGGKAFTIDTVGDAITFMTSTNNELSELIKKVFDSFDADGSGFIDIKELKAIAKDLGAEMTDAEADNCMKDLDYNKDGKISFEEFSDWWRSGRASFSPALKRLIGMKLKASKLLEGASATIKRVEEKKAEISDRYKDKLATSSIRVALNQFEESGLRLFAKLHIFSPSFKDLSKHFCALSGFASSDLFFVISLKVSGDADAHQKTVEETC
jgi:uncharacterized protein (UPF0335 family)